MLVRKALKVRRNTSCYCASPANGPLLTAGLVLFCLLSPALGSGDIKKNILAAVPEALHSAFHYVGPDEATQSSESTLYVVDVHKLQSPHENKKDFFGQVDQCVDVVCVCV